MKLALPSFLRRSGKLGVGRGASGASTSNAQPLLADCGPRTKLAVRLSWVVPVSGEGSTIPSLRRLAKKSRSTLYLRQTAQKQGAEYFAFLPGKPPKGVVRVVSLASWFAHLSGRGTHLYIRPWGSEGDLAVALASDGEPDPDVDTVMSPSDVLVLAQNMRREDIKARVVFDALFGEALPEWASPLRDIASIESPLEGEPPLTAILQKIPEVRSNRARQNLMLLAAVGFAGYVGYSEVYVPWQKAKAPPPTPPVPPEVVYLDARNAALAASGPHIGAAHAVGAIHALLADVPLARGGFLLKSVKCDTKSRQCDLTWQQSTGTFVQYEREDPRNLWGARYAADLSLNSQMRVTAAETPIDADKVPVEQEFLRDQGSAFQQINFTRGPLSGKASMTPAVLVGRYTGSQPVFPGRLLSGTWSIEMPLGLLYVLEDLPRSMTVSLIEVTVGGAPGEGRFKASGAYYVR